MLLRCILVTTFLHTAFATPCTPIWPVAASISEGIEFMEYDSSAASGGVYPKTTDASGCPRDCKQDRDQCPQSCSHALGPGYVEKMKGIAVANPGGTGPFPLFVWFPGTDYCYSRAGPLQIIKAMAQRGFVSASIEYPQWWTYCTYEFEKKAETVAKGALSILCALPQVDCSLGIGSAGYSQGGHLALLAAKYEPRVTAALIISSGPVIPFNCAQLPWGGGAGLLNLVDDAQISKFLPKEKRRSLTVDDDPFFNHHDTDYDSTNRGAPSIVGAYQNQRRVSGYDCGSQYHCLQEDGSGYFIMKSDCYAMGKNYHELYTDFNTGQLHSWWLEGTEAWALPNNLDWLCSAARTSSDPAAPLCNHRNVTGSSCQPLALSHAVHETCISGIIALLISILVTW